MFRRLAIPLVLIISILVASFGLTRLRFDTDILSMLPDKLPEVKGLKAFHEAFSSEDELVMLIQGGPADEGLLPAAAESLGEHLEKTGVIKSARWKPKWMDEPQGFAELLAYLWLNGPPAVTETQLSRLSPEKSEATLKAAVENVGTAMEGMDMVMQAHDPFGFLSHPAVSVLTDSSGKGGEAYESADGLSHLLFVNSPKSLEGYRPADEWMTSVRNAIADWQKGDGEGLTVRLTGEPAFSSEIGRSMENDLSGSISITLGLIGILFWWMQRRLSLLLGLIGVLILVFTVALGVAGWLYGELSIMALSSVEILIGLAVDYGLVICQEAKVAGHDKKELRKAASRPVFCGALTTTVVFLALNFGGLPGMAQLGTIVAVGLSAAAVFMLVIYLPFVAKFGVDRAPATGSGKILPRSKAAWGITGVLCVAAILLLAFHGMPGAEFDSKIMRPRNSDAMGSLEAVQKAFPAYQEKSLGLVVEAKDDAEMLRRFSEAKSRLDQAKETGWLAGEKLPVGWWPDAEMQAKNRSNIAALAADQNRLLAEADAAGFTEEGTVLGKAVLAEMAKQVAATEMVFPQSESARDVMRLFISRKETGGGFLLGSVQPAAGIDPAGDHFDEFRTLTGDGIWLSGWDLFKPAIAKLVSEDLTRVLVPMFVFLLAMLIVIFRRASDVCLTLLAMAVSTLLLLAIMSATGLTWNFVNLMATPLLLGTGIDYAIHVTLSLRRTGGNFKDLWNGTGKALLFCGASNVIGFGSLCFSSSDALVSLGIVAVIGITLSMAVSIFLLPGWKYRISPSVE